MKKASLIMACLLFLGVLSALVLLPGNVKAKTLYVGGAGPGNYTTIQGAIDDADPGDTIYVYNGTYHEHIQINKPLSLSGENRDATIVDGSGTGTVLLVSADWVNISGFTIANGGQDLANAGIELNVVNNCSIAHTNVSNNREGIFLFLSNNNVVENNTVLSNSGIGIGLLYSKGNTLVGNTMIGDGIYIFGDLLEHWNTHNIDVSNTVNGNPVYYWRNVSGGVVPSGAGQAILANCTNVVIENQSATDGSLGIKLGFSSSNLVTRNTASRNNFDGILLSYSDNNTIIDNTASSNKRDGIHLIFSTNNTIVGNDAALNGGDGINVAYSNDNTIATNNISLSYSVGLRLDSSNGNRVYHNLFMNNTKQAYDNTGTNQWDDGYPSGGNYWSDYTGDDEFSGPNQNQPGSDGIGDTPYVIDIGLQDEYPLMSPTAMIHPQPPRILRASLSGGSLENVTLVWSLSPDDGMGLKSVVGYEIYRNMTYDPEGLGYGLVASLPNGTSTFIDNYTGEGDPNNYFYRVCAIDLNDNTTCAYNQAAKFTRPLTEGPNLVSIPLIQLSESIETVLQMVKFDKAWTYDSFSGKWKWYMKFKPYRGSLTSMNETKGYWINVTKDCNFTMAGIVPHNTRIHLVKGWNLVSFPSFKNNYTVLDLKLEVSATRVEGHSSSSDPYYLAIVQDMEKLRAGFAHWVEVPEGTLWLVSND